MYGALSLVRGRDGTLSLVRGRDGALSLVRGWDGALSLVCGREPYGFNLSLPPARYQAEAGGSPYKAITYYHHAISIDPTKGNSQACPIAI